MPAKAKRKVSAATLARLKALRKANGLGEFRKKTGSSRGKTAKRSTTAKSSSTSNSNLGFN